MDTSTSVVEVRNPEAFKLPEVVALFERGFRNQPVDGGVLCTELAARVPADDVLVLIGCEEGQFAAFAVVAFPHPAFSPQPEVFHFYNEGPATLRNQLTDKIVAVTRERGYGGLYAANWACEKDETWCRLFRRAGQIEKVGAVFRIMYNV